MPDQMSINELNELARELREEDSVESAVVRGIANKPITQTGAVLEIESRDSAYFPHTDLRGVDVFGLRSGNLVLQ